ncbi:MAG TPA: ABC transporter permease [Vicinamibacterales bacterium]|nr:ABC transporter permease [Vicinamibacterales bacterium]
MRTIGLETRYAFRSLRKTPMLTGIVVLTLALGLGANAAVFAIIDALVIRPFPFRDVDRIAMIWDRREGSSFDNTDETISPANFLDLRRRADTFEHLTAFQWWDVNLVGRDEPERVQGFFVSPGFFRIIGVQPVHGRAFLPVEETFGEHRRAVLGYGLWQRRFGGDPAIVGQTITLDAEAHEVVGIAPPGFDFPTGAEVWAPLAFDTETAAVRNRHYLTVIGRLAPGRSLEDAKAQVAVIGDNLRQQFPDANRNRTTNVWTLSQGMIDQGLSPVLALWQASAIFVLVIGCANIASLLLARAAERQRDVAVRLAMGASQGRVVRELLLESALLALAAVPAAIAVAWISLEAFRGAMPAKILKFVPGWESIDVDWRLIAVTTALALLTSMIFGMLPSLQAARPRLAEALKEGGRSATVSRTRQRLRRGLVVAEVALALPLLVASGMGALGAYRFLNGPQGYDPDGVLTMRLVLPDAKYSEAQVRRNFTSAVVDRLSALPGVEAAAAVNVIPSIGSNSGRAIEIEGQPIPDPVNPPSADFRSATPGIFDAMRIPLLSGRAIAASDRPDTQPVAVVSDSLARRSWPDADPLGRRIKVGTEWRTVVGVAGDIIQDWFSRRNIPTVYVPYEQSPAGSLVLVLRTSSDPATLTAGALGALRAVDPTQPAYDVMPMRQVLQERTIGLQYIASIMGVFGTLALLLAVVGVYGLMTYLVAQRTHEIGVRIALGASRRDVMGLTVGQAGRLTAIGAVIGVLLSVAVGRLIEAGLVGSATSDPRLVLAFAAVLVGAALAAGYLPARRAAAIDPIIALRAE